MSKIIDKIITSATPPNNTNVLWNDGNGLNIYKNGKWESAGAPMINITYAELVELRNNNKLIAGMQYRITDYVTTTAQENTKSAGNQFDVIVTADNENTLNEVARACLHDGDTYFSENGARLETWKIWYCLDNDIERFAWACPSDGILKKMALVKYGYEEYTAYRDASLDYVLNGKIYYAWNQGGEAGLICYSDTLDITPDSVVYDNSGVVDNTAYFLVKQVKGASGTGVIYRMIDEWNNDIPYDFKNILFVDMNKSKISAEANYYSNWWAGTLVRDSAADKQSGPDSYRYAWILTNVSGPSSSDVWYTDSNSIQSVDTVFYEYDGVEFRVSETIRITNLMFGQMQYTFGNALSSYSELSEFVDYTVCTKNCYFNIIKPMFFLAGIQELNVNTFGNNCYYNSFNNNCHSNIFGDNCYYNSFGKGCIGNTFGINCFHNTFKYNCSSNTFNGGSLH